MMPAWPQELITTRPRSPRGKARGVLVRVLVGPRLAGELLLGEMVIPIGVRVAAKAVSDAEFYPGMLRRALGGKAPGGEVTGRERLVRRRVRDIRRWCGFLFLDLGEEPGPGRGRCPLLLRMIVGETAGLEDYRAQFGDAAATRIVEVHERKPGPRHRSLQERNHRFPRQAMLAAQMQKSADKAMAAVSVVIAAARPVAVLAKMLEHQVEQLHRLCDLAFRHG
jgi:hypothetical protein